MPMTNLTPELRPLLPVYAEYGLRDWLAKIHDVIPISSSWLSQLLQAAVGCAHPKIVGYTFGKVLDLAAHDNFTDDITYGLATPYHPEDIESLTEFTAAVRTHMTKVCASETFNIARYHSHQSSPHEVKCRLFEQIWLMLEKCAIGYAPTSHVCSTLLLLWRDTAYSPVQSHAGGLGGFYRFPLAAYILQSDYVEPIYRGLFDWHRQDLDSVWLKRHPYEPYEHAASEEIREQLFSMVCPSYASAFNVWRMMADKLQYHELCQQLRCAADVVVTTQLPDDLVLTDGF